MALRKKVVAAAQNDDRVLEPTAIEERVARYRARCRATSHGLLLSRPFGSRPICTATLANALPQQEKPLPGLIFWNVSADVFKTNAA